MWSGPLVRQPEGRSTMQLGSRWQGHDLLRIRVRCRCQMPGGSLCFLTASVAVVTDPRDEQAAAFYQEFGFIPLNDRRMVLSMRYVTRVLQTRPA